MLIKTYCHLVCERSLKCLMLMFFSFFLKDIGSNMCEWSWPKRSLKICFAFCLLFAELFLHRPLQSMYVLNRGRRKWVCRSEDHYCPCFLESSQLDFENLKCSMILFILNSLWFCLNLQSLSLSLHSEGHQLVIS
jgi:hypothetical protein